MIRVLLSERIKKTADKLSPDLHVKASQAIAAVGNAFGDPHHHRGPGLRKLAKRSYEIVESPEQRDSSLRILTNAPTRRPRGACALRRRAGHNASGPRSAGFSRRVIEEEPKQRQRKNAASLALDLEFKRIFSRWRVFTSNQAF